MINNIINKTKKAELTTEQLGKIILVVIGLLILIYIVTVVLKGDISSQTETTKNVFSGLK